MRLDIYQPVAALKNPSDPSLRAKAPIAIKFEVEVRDRAFDDLIISDLYTTGFTPNELKMKSVTAAGFGVTNDPTGKFTLIGNDTTKSHVPIRISITAELPAGSFVGDGGVRFLLVARRNIKP